MTARIAGAVLLVLALPAVAAEPSKERARKLLAEGLAHVEAHDWERALAKFNDAYALYASPLLLVNIGNAQRELDRPVEALEAYEQFLAAPGSAKAELVADARRYAAQLATRVGSIAVEAPVGTIVALDDREVGHAPLAPLRSRTGAHKLRIAVPGRDAVDLFVEVKAGETARVRPPAQEAAAPAAPATVKRSEPRRTSTPPPRWYRRWPVWAAAGALVVVGVVAGVWLAGAEDAAATGGEQSYGGRPIDVYDIPTR